MTRILDVGSGIGGSCRFLARRFGCEVTGIDLTREYCDVATLLSERSGFGEQTSFKQASALELPFSDGSFDLVVTEHVQMNIEDKARFYGEIARVLRPGGRFAFHDIFAGSKEPIHFPVPWANDPAISFLIDPHELRNVLQASGLRDTHWEDKTNVSSEFFIGVMKGLKHGPPPVGIHLVMGESARVKLGNMARNLEEERVTILIAMLEKPAG